MSRRRRARGGAWPGVLLLAAALPCSFEGAAAGRGAPPAARTPTVAVMSADARLIAAQHRGRISIWRADGHQLAAFSSRTPFRGALGRGALLAVFADGPRVLRGPRFRRAVRLSLPRGVSTVVRTGISADGRLAAVAYAAAGGAGDPDAVRLWRTKDGKHVGSLRLPAGRVQGFAFSPAGGYVALFGDLQRRRALLRVYRLRGRRRPRLWFSWSNAADGTTYSAAFSTRDRRLALGSGRRIVLWDVRRRKLLGHAPTAAARALFPRRVRRMIRRFPAAHGLVFSPDGRQLLSFHAYGAVGVARWGVSPLRPLRWIKRPRRRGTIRQLAWDRRGIWVVTAGYAADVTLYRAARGVFTRVRALTPAGSRR